MRPTGIDNLNRARRELQDSQAELEELEKQMHLFEAVVDARLGSLLDQLIDLNAETASLNEEIRRIREQRLFGGELMSYAEGAPRPARPPNLKDLPPLSLPQRDTLHATSSDATLAPGVEIPDIKTLYRKLARRYHPDLARNDADRAQSNSQMAEINAAYYSGDLPALMSIAGMTIPYGVNLTQPPIKANISPNVQVTEAEQLEAKLREVRSQIARLGSLPLVKLSLEVKLARHQGRDLLHEMAAELRYKVARKTAERDYLQSQIATSSQQNQP
jgi:hypothetical protein